MPLYEYRAETAISTRKSNPASEWGSRSEGNRVEPVALPDFDVPFHLEPGERIFTVGSCFARNVEVELMKRGYEIPMRALFSDEAFRGVEIGAVNNFSTPSIRNEFAWAFGTERFEPQDHILEVQKGLFVDLHVIASTRPAPYETVLKRRQAITAAYASVRECRVVIMTLGLVECWYDTSTGHYLNGVPRPSMIRAMPDRFTLRVLSFEETSASLEEALSLILAQRPDMRIILTVSPVPLAATHRPQDVMVANCYSKSVLRAVAETAAARHPQVAYYPSYESVTLSERSRVWTDDLVHVTDDIVAINVGRMVDAYAPSTYDAGAMQARIEAGGPAAAVEAARALRRGDRRAAEAFFAAFGEIGAHSPEFALEQAQFLLETGRPEAAIEIADREDAAMALDVVAGDALMKAGRQEAAAEKYERAIAAGAKSASVWSALLTARLALGDLDGAVSLVARWARVAPKRAPLAYAQMSKHFLAQGDLKRAENFARHAVALNPEDARAGIALVDLLSVSGRIDEARAVLDTVHPVNPVEKLLYDRLSSVLRQP